MGAADIGLAPYTRMLNSGAVLPYQSLNLPGIASNFRIIWEGMRVEIGERVHDNSAGRLIGPFQASKGFSRAEPKKAVGRYADQLNSLDLSHNFPHVVVEKLDQHLVKVSEKARRNRTYDVNRRLDRDPENAFPVSG